MHKFLFLSFVLFFSLHGFAQSGWVLKKEEQGMKIYTGQSANSKVKALKAVYTLEATLSQLAALLLDIESQSKWVYSTKSSVLLKKTGNNELIAWSEKKMPNPFSNRDVVTRVKISQHPTTKVMTVQVTGLPDYVPEKKGLVRVPFSKAVWTVTPVKNNLLTVEYIAEADPGGSIPVWVANMFLTKGPSESFKTLATVIQQPKYKNARLDFISN